MIELLISACLTTGDNDCRDFALQFDAREVSLMTCVLHGQAVIARWQDDHPDWQVARWTCSHPERREVAL